MFTVDRSLLRSSTIRRDYKFSQDHQKSFLTLGPTTNADTSPNSSLNAAVDPAFNNDGDVDAYSQLDIEDLDDDIYSASDIDSNNLTLQS
jgi:hypothetical protein